MTVKHSFRNGGEAYVERKNVEYLVMLVVLILLLDLTQKTKAKNNA